MKHCPLCLNELPDDAVQCPVCLAPVQSPDSAGPPTPEWTVVRTVTTAFEAELMAGRLRSYGVPACVLSQVDSTRGFTVGLLAIAKVFVPKDRLDESCEILDLPADDVSAFDQEA